MKTETGVIERTYTIPVDLLMDVLRVVLKYKLSNRIAGINVRDNFLHLNVKFPEDHRHGKDIRSNIETMLSDWSYYMNASPDDGGFDIPKEGMEDNYTV